MEDEQQGIKGGFMSKEESIKRPKFLSEAILAIIIPIFGYILAYNYENAFCAELKIPQEFIEINLIQGIRVTVILLGLIITIWLLSEFLHALKLFESVIGRLILRISLVVIIACYFIFTTDLPLYAIILIILFPVSLIFQYFVLPLFYRRLKGYKKKIEYEINSDFKKDTLADKLARKIGLNAFLILFFIFSVYFASGLIGGFHAKTRVSFMIIKSSPELVVLRKYSQNFICASFDREKKKIKKNFYLKSVDQIVREGFEIVVEDMGPLQLEKKPTRKKWIKEEKQK